MVEAKNKEEVYQEKLAQLELDDVKGHYVLGLWCQRNRLAEQAQAQFEKVVELEPTHRDARRKLGYIKYKGKWIKPAEKPRVDYEEKLRRIKDDDIKGHYSLRIWCKQRKLVDEARAEFAKVIQLAPEHKKARKELDNISELAKEVKISEIIKRFGVYQGVLDKPGADKENLPWEKARAKETDHFMVKTNLSVDALNDICWLLECAYLTWLDFFGFPEPKEKLKVVVPKNRVEFEKMINDLLGYPPPAQADGRFSPKDEDHKSREDHLLAYYKGNPETARILLHEGTHYALRLVARDPPIWLDEGIATYFESSKLEGKRLVTNLIDPFRLPDISKAINNDTCIKLRDFINTSQSEYLSLLCYAEGWSLVYFLINGQKGKYKQGLQAYIEAWKKKKISMKCAGGNLWIQDKEAHTKLFEECMGLPAGQAGVSIDQLEEEWKEYIRKLK